MATNLLESYAKRIKIAESVYSKAHEGEGLDNHKKLILAKCLHNVDKYMTEAFDGSMGTQRADMGLFKKFCLNLTNVALPNLIANELVMVSPMSSMSGYITYVQYTAGTTKGETAQGDVFNDPFRLGKVDSNYTSERVVEAATAGTGAQALAWTQDGDIAHGVFPVTVGTTTTNYDVKLVKSGAADIYGFYKAADKKFYEEASYTTQITVAADTKVAYVYNNVVVPQEKLPTVKAEMKSIPLIAKARRIAVYYSQMAAYQAKTDYGFDLGDQLAEKAVGQLEYEIDTEVVELIDTTAGAAQAGLTWSKTLPVGVSKRDHYAGFAEIVEIGNQILYDRTRRFAATYMIIASDIKPVLALAEGFKAASTKSINGPYFAGTYNGLKVYVSPAMVSGRYVLGVNGDDYVSSVAVYAPYMPVVPTQLLGFADGGMQQGWSTLYDLKVLNAELCVAGAVTA